MVFMGDYEMNTRNNNEFTICRKCKVTSNTSYIVWPSADFGVSYQASEKEQKRLKMYALCEYCLFGIKREKMK